MQFLITVSLRNSTYRAWLTTFFRKHHSPAIAVEQSKHKRSTPGTRSQNAWKISSVPLPRTVAGGRATLQLLQYHISSQNSVNFYTTRYAIAPPKAMYAWNAR